MNPVTQGLLRQLNDPKLDAFARDWGELEVLVVEIYKQKSLSFAQQAEFFELQERLRPSYTILAPLLEAFWRKTRIKGELVTSDPFLAVLEKQSAKDFVENWDAMKTLPAAREAFNQLLMDKLEKK
jgi:hypothetical protein